MNPRLRQALILLAAAVISCWLAWDLADGAYTWPAFAFTLAGGAILVRLTGLSFDVIALGVVVFGYIVANRGFAQLMPAPSLPLLPAELALLLTGGWSLVASAFERRVPWERDWLNRLLWIWLVVGTARLLFDVREFGLMAIRDFAMVYYSLFFFIAQRVARQERARRFLVLSLATATALLLPVVPLYSAFPDFFLGQLTVRGTPLVYYKGDLAFTFLAVGVCLVFFLATGRRRHWAWPLSAAMFLYVAASDNRASLFGALVAMGLLLAARRWQLPALQATALALALGVLIGLGIGLGNSWAERKLEAAGERIQTMVNVGAVQAFASEETAMKSDNNRFRLVWWRSVATETWQGNPVFGLGFGYDLAKGFLREYNPDIGEEFTTRSPHDVFLSVFGRMGAAGLAVWLALCGLMAAETWRSFRRGDDDPARGLWCAVWVILASATFGVVLEGPMGAVPFWTILGLAHAMGRAQPPGSDLNEVASPPDPTAIEELREPANATS